MSNSYTVGLVLVTKHTEIGIGHNLVIHAMYYSPLDARLVAGHNYIQWLLLFYMMYITWTSGKARSGAGCIHRNWGNRS